VRSQPKWASAGPAQVVTPHHRDSRGAQPQLAGDARDVAGRPVGVGRAEVADDADAGGQAAGEHGPHEVVEQRLVTGLGVVAARQLRECQRAFGQRLEDQHRRTTGRGQCIDHRAGGVGAVARETGGTAYAQDGFHHVAPAPADKPVHRGHCRQLDLLREVQRSYRMI
jgi:hypothetical protein